MITILYRNTVIYWPVPRNWQWDPNKRDD